MAHRAVDLRRGDSGHGWKVIGPATALPRAVHAVILPKPYSNGADRWLGGMELFTSVYEEEVWYGMVRVWYGMVRYGTVWYGT